MFSLSRFVVTHRLIVAAAAALIAVAASTMLIWIYGEGDRQRHQLELEDRLDRYALEISAETVNGRVMGAVILLGLLDESIKRLVGGDSQQALPEINERLRVVTHELGASNAFVVNADGSIAAYQSRAAPGGYGVGRDEQFRPYFQQAMKGQPNVYPGIGSGSNRRGLYFAAPVYRSASHLSPVIGVVVIKVGLGAVDDLLGASTGPALLLSPQGVVFASNRPEWRYRVAGDVNERRTNELTQARQFGAVFQSGRPRPLPFPIDGDHVRIDGVVHAVARAPLAWNDPLGDWTLVLLENETSWFPPHQKLLIVALVTGLISLFTIALVFRARDVQNRRRANAEIRRNEEQYRTLVGNIPGAVYRCAVDANWTMHFISDAIEPITGYPTGDFLQNAVRSYASIIHPDDTDMVEQEVMTGVQSHRPFELEYRIMHADGSYRWIYEKGRAVYDDTGRAQYLDGTILDITDRKRANQLIEDAKKRLQQIADSVPGAVYQFRIGSDGTQALNFVSDGVKDLFGVDRARALADVESLTRRLAPEDRERLRSATTLPEDQLRPRRNEFKVHDERGNEKWILGASRPHREPDGSIIWNGYWTEITDRKHMEQALAEAKSAAEQANRAKSDFLANMSHEIRTPMNAIIGLSHLALGTELSTRQQDYLTKIHNSATDLLRIINDILDFSKIEAGKLDMERVDFDLEKVLDNVAQVGALEAHRKGLEFLYDVAPDVPTRLIGDPLRLGQVLINLTNNAFKFTEQGEVTVSVRQCSKDAQSVGLEFGVEDTGVGMSEVQKQGLFTAFSQGDSSTTRRYGGTGLGLTISKRLVDMMDGEIGVESSPGNGSRFRFTARFGRADASPAAVPDTLRDLRALIVDDNAESRRILERQLNSFGCRVSAVDSGSQAIRELEAAADDDPYRLVLMDWKMPGLSGIETARRIQQDPAVRIKPHIVVSSAYGREQPGHEVENADVAGYVLKPASRSRLLDAILDALGHSATGRDSRTGPAQAGIPRRLQSLHLLLVEDNELNQQVAEEILRGAGIRVTVAGDGKQALDALGKEHFDGVLMDLQMPVMDGFEATRAIRGELGLTDLPVIAMTANVMAGDRERCLEAGMNDHVAKPIEIEELFDALERWLRPGHRPVREITPDAQGEPAPELPGFDSAAGVRRMGGNAVAYRRLLLKFRDSQADMPERIREALDRRDESTAVRLAHTLKGVAGNLGAVDVQAASAALETAIREQRKTETTSALDQVREVLDQALASIDNAQPATPGEIQAGPMTPPDTGNLKAALDELYNLLADNDADARGALEVLEQLLTGRSHRARLDTLGRLINDYEYEAALHELEKLRDALGLTA